MAVTVRVAPGVHRRGTYEGIVVPVLVDDPLSLHAAEVAGRLSASAARVVLAHVLEVPRELPLDALFPDEEESGRALLRRAAAIVEAYAVHAVSRLERAHDAARVVLDVADEYGADLIVVATPRRARRGRSVFDDTVTGILHHATCRVLLAGGPLADGGRAA